MTVSENGDARDEVLRRLEDSDFSDAGNDPELLGDELARTIESASKESPAAAQAVVALFRLALSWDRINTKGICLMLESLGEIASAADEKEQSLKEDLRALVESTTTELVGFQMEAFGKRHQDALAVLARKIESLEAKNGRGET